MSSPVVPSELLSLLPSPTASMCDAFLRALIAFPLKVYQIFNWMLDANGNPSAAFLQLQRIPGTFIISGFAMNEATDYVLFCDGRAVSRTTYSALFTKVGTTFGAGDGVATFNIPNCVDRFLVGAGGLYSVGATGGEATHVLTVAEMPAHNHPISSATYPALGSGSTDQKPNVSGPNVSGNTGGGAAHNTLPPYMGARVYISY